MHGSPNSSNFTRAGGPAVSTPSPLNGISNSTGGSRTGGSMFEQGTLWALVAFIGVYVAWAYIELHQPIRESVAPKNIAINIRNMLLITFTVVIGINIAKVALAKMAAWGIPAAGYMLTIVGNA